MATKKKPGVKKAVPAARRAPNRKVSKSVAKPEPLTGYQLLMKATEGLDHSKLPAWPAASE